MLSIRCDHFYLHRYNKHMFKIPICLYQTSIKWNTKIWPFVDTLSCQKAQKDLKKETLKMSDTFPRNNWSKRPKWNRTRNWLWTLRMVARLSISVLLPRTRMDIFKNIIVLRSLRSIYSRSTLNKQILSVSLKTERQIITWTCYGCLMHTWRIATTPYL